MNPKDKTPTRRSSRKRKEENSPAPEQSIASPPKAQRGRKRRIPPVLEEISTPAEVVAPKIRMTAEGRKIDCYCWICHKPGQDIICNQCPRVYHEQCMQRRNLKLNSTGCCNDCQMLSLTNGIEPERFKRLRLKQLLLLAMQEAVMEDSKKNSLKIQTVEENPNFCRYLQSWPMYGIDDLCEIMDLDILLDKINDNFSSYASCAAFFADVKWIYHNCCIFYGVNSVRTKMALKFEKNMKQELLDIEACPDCYFDKHSYKHLDYFLRICPKLHVLVWAKLRGSQYWPAKCLKIYNGLADVRFFGTHDRSLVPLSLCYRISHGSPNEKEIKQPKYQEALSELSLYVSHFKGRFDSAFPYYPVRTPLTEPEETC